ncbi:MAG: hypothetical protein GWO24_16210, partial [Akkermansiaceae bacterium]|nr:hypothetical protein [Akkermansiaceae bacterium]
MPLLASNIFAGGSLLLLTASLRKRHGGWLNALLCGVLTAAAVGFRRDSALVLPLLCLLSMTRFSLAGVFRESRHWVMVAAAAGVVVLGDTMVQGVRYAPDMFFDVRIFGAYLVFGMAGAAVVLFLLPLQLLISRRRWFLRAATGAAMLLPFAFYTPYLYTPRHFLLPTLLVLLVLILPRGELWWQAILRRRLHRFLAWSAVVASAVLWLVGVRL